VKIDQYGFTIRGSKNPTVNENRKNYERHLSQKKNTSNLWGGGRVRKSSRVGGVGLQEGSVKKKKRNLRRDVVVGKGDVVAHEFASLATRSD